MTSPEFLPVLSSGSHDSPHEGACVMEYVSLLAGEAWSDTPSCTHPVLARAAQVVNDGLTNSERPALVPLIGRLFGTAEVGSDPERQVLTVRLLVWSARQVQHLVASKDQVVCDEAIAAAQAWASEPNATNKEQAARTANAAYTAYNLAAGAASAVAANAAANAAGAAAGNATSAAYTHTASTSAISAAYAHTASGIGFLTGLLDEYDRLTGRTDTDTDPDAAERAQALYVTAVAT